MNKLKGKITNKDIMPLSNHVIEYLGLEPNDTNGVSVQGDNEKWYSLRDVFDKIIGELGKKIG